MRYTFNVSKFRKSPTVKLIIVYKEVNIFKINVSKTNMWTRANISIKKCIKHLKLNCFLISSKNKTFFIFLSLTLKTPELYRKRH